MNYDEANFLANFPEVDLVMINDKGFYNPDYAIFILVKYRKLF